MTKRLVFCSLLTVLGLAAQTGGGVVPGARIGAENLDGPNREATVADVLGAFRFAGLPSGRYRISVEARGFQVFRSEPVVVGAGESHADAMLDLGGISERIEVVGRRLQPRIPTAVQRVKVGGSVQAAKLVTQVNPVYPDQAQQAGLEGTVLLKAVIRTDGVPMSLTAVSSAVDPELVSAAMEAVKQWRYEPTMLNGFPVEVVSTITVSFRLN